MFAYSQTTFHSKLKELDLPSSIERITSDLPETVLNACEFIRSQGGWVALKNATEQLNRMYYDNERLILQVEKHLFTFYSLVISRSSRDLIIH